MSELEANEDDSKTPDFVCGSLAEALGLKYDPNERTQTWDEGIDMLKSFTVSKGEEVTDDFWSSAILDDDDDEDEDDEYDRLADLPPPSVI